jgi:hypothetical protein
MSRRFQARIASIGAALLLATSAPVLASSVTIGVSDPTSPNCIPFGCPDGFVLTRYQQVFDASAFSGPIAIDAMTLFHTTTFGAVLATASYSISFSTTAKPVGGLSTALGSNVGADQTFFALAAFAGGTMPAALTFTGISPFVYNPAAGNLLVDILVSVAGPDGGAFLDAERTDPLTSRAFVQAGSGTADRLALVTRFDYHAATAVPEPMTLVLLGSGLAWRGLRARRARR